MQEQFQNQNSNPNPNQRPNNKRPPQRKRKGSFYWIYIGIFLIFLFLQVYSSFSNSAASTTQSEFFNTYLRDDHVERIVIVNNESVEIFIKEEALRSYDKYKSVRGVSVGEGINPGPHYQFKMGSLENFEKKIDEYKSDSGITAEVSYETRKNFFTDMIGWLMPFIIIAVIWIFLMRRMTSGGGGGGAGGLFNIGKSKAQVFDEKNNIKVSFKDVAGLEGAKYEVQEVVNFLKKPQKYTALGGKIPKGVLLVGPPGTGKTLLAKAMAGEAGVPFFSLSGSDFVEMFVGIGASRVRDLFKQAKTKSPAIIFIDEIDAIGRARGRNQMMGGNDERENTLNQLLTEMDGFGTDTNVIVIAATNRADVLDRALMRAGRFDRQVFVDLPDLNERIDIFKVYLKKLKLGRNIDAEFLSRQTPGFSGADIANACNEAALVAARKDKKSVGRQDFLDAVDRIIGGLEKKTKIITPSEKKVIAYHEAGHATVSWFLEYAAPLVKVTIVPRGQSLGAAWYLPEERQITTLKQISDEMCATLGGRAAEKVIFNSISTGALSDLEKVTKQAMAVVTVYGLNDKIGNITYYDSTGQSEYNFTKPYSDQTAKLIDSEISNIVEEQYKRAIDLLEEKKEGLIKVAERLLEKEVIFKEDLEDILGERPFKVEERVPASKSFTKKKPARKRKTKAQQDEEKNVENPNPQS